MTDKRNIATLLLAGATISALYACYLLFRPYATPILFACVIAIVFHPVHHAVQRVLQQKNVSAIVSTILTVLLGVAPLVLLLVAASSELSGLYQSLAAKNSGTSGIVAPLLQGAEQVLGWLASHFHLPAIDLKELLLRRLESGSSALVRLGATILSNAFTFIVNSVIALVILFFLYRDGESAVSRTMAALPFPQDRLMELRARISSTVVTNFYGGVMIGALQGTLTGITFWALGLDSPVLWGLVTGIFSLLPMVGTAVVWVPAAIVLLLTGHVTKGIILLALGTAVIGTVDNLIRPLILRKSVHLHMLLVFFALLGGLQLFGVPGLFVGPVILSVTAALLLMLKEDLAGRNQLAAPVEPPAQSFQSMGR